MADRTTHRDPSVLSVYVSDDEWQAIVSAIKSGSEEVARTIVDTIATAAHLNACAAQVDDDARRLAADPAFAATASAFSFRAESIRASAAGFALMLRELIQREADRG